MTPNRRRRLRWLLLLLGGVLIPPTVFWLYFTSEGGSEWIRGQALEAANQALQGRVEAKRLKLGGAQLVLEDVKLFTPEGELVAEIGRVVADPQLWALTSGRVVLRSVRIERPRFYLKMDERGLNLERAIAAKVKGPPSEQKLYVDLGDVKLTEGYFDYEFGERRYTVDRIAIEGAASVSAPTLSLTGTLHLGARVVAPLEDTIELDVTAKTIKPGEVAMQLFGRTSDTRIKGILSLDPPRMVIEESVASARAIRAFVPQLKLKVPVSVTGVASTREVDVAVLAGSARATAKAKFPKDRILDQIELHADGVDLSELIEGGRPSKLAANLAGKLNEAGLDTLDGELTGQAAWTEDGKPLATADLDVKAVKGKVEVKSLQALVPGAQLKVSGSGDREQLSLSGGLEVTDLGAVAQTIADFTGAAPPPLAGVGSLKVGTSGPLLHPSVTAKGGFKHLRVGDTVVTDLKLDAKLPDVRRFLEAEGTFSARRVQIGETVLEDVNAQLVTRGRELEVKLTTRGMETLALSALVRGTLDKDNQGLLINAVNLDYPEAKWELVTPAHLGFRDGQVTLTPLALRSGDQRISIEGSLREKLLAAAAQLQSVDLALLPRALVPASLGLGGRIDAKANASGSIPKLKAALDLQWHAGTLKKLSAIELTSHGELAGERVTGTLSLGSSVGSAKGDFSVPLSPTGAGKRQPIQVRLETGAIDLVQATAAFEATTPVEGVVTVALEVVGTPENPQPTLTVESTTVRWCGEPCLSFDRALVKLTGERQPNLSAALTGFGGLIQVGVKAPMGWGELLEAYLPPPRKKGAPPVKPGIDWLNTPLEVTTQADGVDLAQVGNAAQLSAPLLGKLQLTGSAKGTIRHPDVTLEASVAGFQREGLHPLEVKATVKTTRDESAITLGVGRGGKQALGLQARLGGALETLLEEEQLTRTGLLVDAELGPMQLGDVWKPIEGSEASPAGLLKAQLSVTGTGAAPRASLRGTLEQLKVGKVPLGHANVAWDYQAGKHVLSTALTSVGGGTLKGHAELTLDVSVPAIRKGLAPAKAPLKATLNANKFDLAFLSGIHPMVRTAGGQLRLDAQVEGMLFSPGFNGTVEWTNGRLAAAGFGEYRNAHLLLKGSNDGYALEDLTANAGAGQVTMKAAAMRVREGVFSLSATSAFSNFPIITDDQLLAIATMRLQLDGEASDALIDIQRLMIPEAKIELPEVKRKDLQGLERPPDIVLVRNGVPVHRKKPKAAAGEAAQVARVIRVLIDAPRNLWVKSSDVNLELGLSEKFRLEITDKVLMYGEATVLRGRLDVIGRRFDVQKDSQVRFAGLAAQPYINVTAVHVNEREGVTVFVTVVGKGKDFNLKTSSQPPLPDSEIFTLLTTGRRTLKRGGGSSISATEAASVLGALAASQLKTLVAKKLPLDVLSIESGKEGIQNVRVEAGTYLSDKVYLGYQLQVGADRRKGENVNAGKIEYQISRSWSLEATAGDAPAAGAELVWSREY